MRRASVKALVFLGGGRITTALVAGLRLAKYNQPIVVFDRHRRKLQLLQKTCGVEVAGNLRDAMRQAKLLVIAVRPDSVKDLLRQIGEVRQPLLAVSLAAGVPLAKLRAGLGPPVRWARAMPSPVCRVGRGLTALVFAHDFPRHTRTDVRNLFRKVGQVLEISETQLDAFTVTYSSSHGYHALETLAGAAESLGLPRQTALTAAAHALADGIFAWRESGLSLGKLLEESATPGGIAAAVMESKDRAGYKKAVKAGLAAGLARARNNAGRA